jgi:phosphocarrier protein
MREFVHRVGDKNGLHARPAGLLAMVAKSFESDIRVYAQGKEADGKRLLSLMSLGAREGTEMRFVITGNDEEQAEQALKSHCKEKLDGE